MACLGDASRFRLVQALIGGARCVTALAVDIGLSQSCTTRHLQALERRRVVHAARDGKRVLYRLRQDEPALKPLLAWALATEAAGATSREAGPDDRVGTRVTGSRSVAGVARKRLGIPAAPDADAGPPGRSAPADRMDRVSLLQAPTSPAGERGEQPPTPRRLARPELEDYLL
jgi:ArsR family transcriptional regulator